MNRTYFTMSLEIGYFLKCSHLRKIFYAFNELVFSVLPPTKIPAQPSFRRSKSKDELLFKSGFILHQETTNGADA